MTVIRGDGLAGGSMCRSLRHAPFAPTAPIAEAPHLQERGQESAWLI